MILLLASFWRTVHMRASECPFDHALRPEREVQVSRAHVNYHAWIENRQGAFLISSHGAHIPVDMLFWCI
jgi:hypothetical protein